MFALLELKPVGRPGDPFGRRGRRVQPTFDSLVQVRLGPESAREPDVRDLKIVRVEQFAKSAQPLQLGWPVDSVSSLTSGRRHQAGRVEIAKHSRRPSRRFRSLIDCEPVHATNLTTSVSGFHAIVSSWRVGTRQPSHSSASLPLS